MRRAGPDVATITPDRSADAAGVSGAAPTAKIRASAPWASRGAPSASSTAKAVSGATARAAFSAWADAAPAFNSA